MTVVVRCLKARGVRRTTRRERQMPFAARSESALPVMAPSSVHDRL